MSRIVNVVFSKGSINFNSRGGDDVVIVRRNIRKRKLVLYQNKKI